MLYCKNQATIRLQGVQKQAGKRDIDRERERERARKRKEEKIDNGKDREKIKEKHKKNVQPKVQKAVLQLAIHGMVLYKMVTQIMLRICINENISQSRRKTSELILLSI